MKLRRYDKMSTGNFNQEMNEYFGSEVGAYTTFTQEEIRKSTYNVKVVIRDILINKMGREQIPVVNVSENQNIDFKTCKRTKSYNKDSVSIQCKFSKQDKDEMTIYFPRTLINEFNAVAGDIWYIYFVKNEKTPYFGIISQIKWNDFFVYDTALAILEEDEIIDRQLEYEINLDNIKLNRVIPIIKEVVILGDENSHDTTKSLSAENAGRREKNKKIKGDIGELIVIEIEKRRFRIMNREDLIPKITHVAKKKDGLGYDIISTDVDAEGKEKEIYIEVKTTSGNIDMPFFVSSREVKVSNQLGMAYYIYRLFNLNEKSTEIDYYTMQGALVDNFNLDPTNYRATFK